jgi:hypothetical protein
VEAEAVRSDAVANKGQEPALADMLLKHVLLQQDNKLEYVLRAQLLVRLQIVLESLVHVHLYVR